MSKIQFTGTATQPQRNRKFCQFNKDQYCTQILTCDIQPIDAFAMFRCEPGAEGWVYLSLSP